MSMQGARGNLSNLRRKFLEATGTEWLGTDHLLRILTRESTKIPEVLAKMEARNTSELPDDPALRPLGHVSDAELLAELSKRPKLLLTYSL